MSSHNHKNQNGSTKIPSKDMPSLPENFFPVFIKNQFRTTIQLPTKDRYPNVKGQCGIITGSNTGLGYEASRQLLSLGLSHLVMGVRSLAKGKAAASKLRTENPSAKIDVWALDMESYDSIQAFVRKCNDDLPRIDMVILNAGMGAMKFNAVPATGHEKTVQVNHVSTVLLTILLLPVLRKKSRSNGATRPPVITVVNSATAHLCKLPNKDSRPFLASFDDPAKFDANERYGASKLLCQLFIVKLADLVDPNNAIINMVDPGLTKGTELAREVPGFVAPILKLGMAVVGRPLDRAAATYVDAVLGHGKESHGCFLMNEEIVGLSKWYHTDGEALTAAIWNETMQDLKFAGVDEIVASMHT
ncbi:hypothetical protein PV11_08547 [Exophiala sideris]|uniref:Short-chain dehydrogenase/reductase family protein n=1 Tax=Exophiala sideris TaxID=1016849 RepID=A0A0D1VXN7_9EURO|nr:hypothetical protein PV11_08547 [Exophiala sideris]